MAGIGFELKKIYGRKTLAANLWGTFYATMTTIGPAVLSSTLIVVLKLLLCAGMYIQDGVPLSFLISYYLLGVHKVTAACAALACCYAVIVFALLFQCMKAFGMPRGRYFAFLAYFRRYPKLAVEGFAYTLGIYCPTLIYWFFSGISERVSVFLTTPAYDLIQKERGVMTRTLRHQLFFVYETQLIITVVSVCLVSVFFPYLSASAHMLNMFVLLSLGVYAVFCMYFTIVVFYYFSDYGGACISALVFLAVTALSAAGAVLWEGFYPLPLLVGGLCGWVVSFLLLRRRMKKMDCFLMCRNNK